MKDEIEGVLKSVLSSIKVEDRGVFVQASTLGSLEALLEFLKTSKIPYAGNEEDAGVRPSREVPKCGRCKRLLLEFYCR